MLNLKHCVRIQCFRNDGNKSQAMSVVLYGVSTYLISKKTMVDKTVIKTIRFAFFIVVHTELMMQRNAETHKKAHGYDRAESVY